MPIVLIRVSPLSPLASSPHVCMHRTPRTATNDAQAQQVQDLREVGRPVEAALGRYQSLPPDLSLAGMQLEVARRELARNHPIPPPPRPAPSLLPSLAPSLAPRLLPAQYVLERTRGGGSFLTPALRSIRFLVLFERAWRTAGARRKVYPVRFLATYLSFHFVAGHLHAPSLTRSITLHALDALTDAALLHSKGHRRKRSFRKRIAHVSQVDARLLVAPSHSKAEHPRRASRAPPPRVGGLLNARDPFRAIYLQTPGLDLDTSCKFWAMHLARL